MRVEITDKIKAISKKISPKLVKLRREFHQYPELAFNEFEISEPRRGGPPCPPRL